MSAFPFGVPAALFVFGYLLFMLLVGYVARRKQRGESLDEFYLAGKNLGTFVLLLTLYATQYSGNTLLGYPGEAFRLGFAWVMSVGFMMAIVVVYLIFAPRLYRLSRRHGFVTPGDWMTHRFGSPLLTQGVNLVLIVAMLNFLLAQLIAMGHVVAGLSGNRVPFWLGVVGLALVIMTYETLGGMRAVAWTDCVQGVILLCGLVGLLLAAFPTPGHLQSVTQWLIAHQPEKAAVPTAAVCRTWVSTLLLVGFSGAVYPQAIQRIYAARSTRALKRSLSVMVFMPLFSTLVVFLIGVVAIPHFSALRGVAADQVMPMMLRQWASQSSLLYMLAVLVITGVLAAIMSTADSVLLSLSSMLAKDVLSHTWLRHASERRITRAGKMVSWVVMAGLVGLAVAPKITLWGLTELKMEILSQAAPSIILGTVWPGLSTAGALGGLAAGLCLSVGLTLSGHAKVLGFHAGLLGLGLNFFLCAIVSSLLKAKRPPTRAGN
ncbi:MAG: sodium:solute symporter family protein [Calditrichaeota bacterium]|nr:MAG: sodium:solute symporter family protein [Calditrichota bacterium]